MNFNIDISNVLRGLSETEIRTRAAIGLLADSSEREMERHAKSNAKWEDRTALSRQTIKGDYKWNGKKCNVIIAGYTQHFPYLELANEKKYAILNPTIQKFAPQILNSMRNIL